MICIQDINEYDCVIFYGLQKATIDNYVKYIDSSKCKIVDSNPDIWGTKYNGITISDLDRHFAAEERCALIILPLNCEDEIYRNVRRRGFRGDIYSKDMICFEPIESFEYEKKGKYSIEKHTQILIALLKQYDLRNIVVSPGVCNMNFVYSVQNDDFFNLISCVDERSAGYIACGIAHATGKPVILSCTGATASRNYMSALTEAYYSKIPILAITSSRDSFMIGNGIDQITDRLHIPSDIVRHSVEISFVSNEMEKQYCKLQINKALMHLFLQKGGPVHINLITRFAKDFSVKTLPRCEKINIVSTADTFPDIPKNSALFLLPDCTLGDADKNLIEQFSVKFGVSIIGDHLSNYRGANFVNISLMADQVKQNYYRFDTLILVGKIGKSTNLICENTWRIADDNSIYDKYLNMNYYFDMPLHDFLMRYLERDILVYDTPISNYDRINGICEALRNHIPELPFSNLWIAQNTCEKLPNGSKLYLGIISTLRNWNYFNIPKSVKCYSTVGGFGIDGTMSEMIGSSIINKKDLHFCILGDLSFFYDMNVLGNRNVGKNVRIMIINNNGGNSLITNNGLPNDDTMPMFVGAPDHHKGGENGNVIQAYAESLGYQYMIARDKIEYLEKMDEFLNAASNKPIVFEIRYDRNNDAVAVNLMSNIVMGDES